MFKGDLEGVLKEYLEGDLDVDLEGDRSISKKYVWALMLLL